MAMPHAWPVVVPLVQHSTVICQQLQLVQHGHFKSNISLSATIQEMNESYVTAEILLCNIFLVTAVDYTVCTHYREHHPISVALTS